MGVSQSSSVLQGLLMTVLLGRSANFCGAACAERCRRRRSDGTRAPLDHAPSTWDRRKRSAELTAQPISLHSWLTSLLCTDRRRFGCEARDREGAGAFHPALIPTCYGSIPMPFNYRHWGTATTEPHCCPFHDVGNVCWVCIRDDFQVGGFKYFSVHNVSFFPSSIRALSFASTTSASLDAM